MAEAGLALGGPVALDAVRFGLKASGLDRALRQGEQVPAGFALSAELAARVASRESDALAALELALVQLRALALAPGETGALAVRASPTQSLPGALLTRLEVPDRLDDVVRALVDVVASAGAEAVRERWAAEGLAAPAQAWVAVLVQRQLAFGAEDFGAVVFTHDTHSGEPRVHGEFAAHGVAEVVSGRSHPRPLEHGAVAGGGGSLARERPDAWQALTELAQRLTQSFDQPLDLEVAYCAGTVRLLQARPLTFSARALVRLALAAIDDDSPRYAAHLRELVRRGLHSLAEPQFVVDADAQASALRGVAASPGSAQGVLATDLSRAQQLAGSQPVILLRPDAVPEDVAAFRRAAAIVTSSGGLTCHAAVIARGLGIPAVVGVNGVRIDVARGVLWGGRDGRQQLASEGDWLSVDARRGLIYPGRLALSPRLQDPELQRLFAELLKLRPGPLWVSGPAREALQLKQEATLDGALCPFPRSGELPEGVGRECWVEIEADELDARLPALPRGWGVVVRPGTRSVSFASLRQRFPLRAWGMRFDTTSAPPADAALDLAVLDPHLVPAAAHLQEALDGTFQKRVGAARLLLEMKVLEVPAVPASSNVGWVCPVSTVALTALGYATQRVHHNLGVVV